MKSNKKHRSAFPGRIVAASWLLLVPLSVKSRTAFAQSSPETQAAQAAPEPEAATVVEPSPVQTEAEVAQPQPELPPEAAELSIPARQAALPDETQTEEPPSPGAGRAEPPTILRDVLRLDQRPLLIQSLWKESNGHERDVEIKIFDREREIRGSLKWVHPAASELPPFSMNLRLTFQAGKIRGSMHCPQLEDPQGTLEIVYDLRQRSYRVSECGIEGEEIAVPHGVAIDSERRTRRDSLLEQVREELLERLAGLLPRTHRARARQALSDELPDIY